MTAAPAAWDPGGVPTRRCKSGGLPGWKWGADGACYVHQPDDEAGSKLARRKAVNQGVAMGDIQVDNEEVEMGSMVDQAAAALRGEVPAREAAAAVARDPEYGRLLRVARLVQEDEIELGDGESVGDFLERVRAAVRGRYGENTWTPEVYADAVIVDFYGNDPRAGKCFRVGWERQPDGSVQLVGAEVEVERVTTYVPVGG